MGNLAGETAPGPNASSLVPSACASKTPLFGLEKLIIGPEWSRFSKQLQVISITHLGGPLSFCHPAAFKPQSDAPQNGTALAVASGADVGSPTVQVPIPSCPSVCPDHGRHEPPHDLAREG